MTTETNKIRFSDYEALQGWEAPGQVDPVSFLEAVRAHPEFLSRVEAMGQPTIEDVRHDFICWDRDESENCFFLPEMQEDLDEYLKRFEGSDGPPDMTEPAWVTWIQYDNGWNHEHLAEQNRESRPAPSGGATDEVRHIEDVVNELVVDHDYGGAFDGRTAMISHPADCDDLPHEYTVPLAELVNAVRAVEAFKHIHDGEVIYLESCGEARGIKAIARERARQVLKGFDELGDQGRSNELARAALAYGLYRQGNKLTDAILEQIWPWETSRLEKIADMPPTEKWAKAGALFAAAIDQVSQNG